MAPRFTKAHKLAMKNKIRKVVLVAKQRVPRQVISSAKNHPFGQSTTSNYRYVQKFNIFSGLQCGVQSFRLNSMFDPDKTGTGHQPLFRDTMSGIYARYRINSVNWKLTCININQVQTLIGVTLTQDQGYNPAANDFETNIEKRNTAWKFQSINTNGVVIKSNTKNHRVAGIAKQSYIDERDYSAPVGTNPPLELFLQVYSQSVDLGETTQHFMIEMEYNTTYYEPFTMLQS